MFGYILQWAAIINMVLANVIMCLSKTQTTISADQNVFGDTFTYTCIYYVDNTDTLHQCIFADENPPI